MNFSAFNSTPYIAYFWPVILVNFVDIKQKLLRYAQQDFASFGLLCFANIVE